MWGFIRSFVSFAPRRARREMLSRFVDLSANGAASYITAGLTEQSWLRIAAWLRQFRDFLVLRARRQGRRRPSPKWMADNGVALDFLAQVAAENKGNSRVSAAIRAIDFIRPILGIPDLKLDPRCSLLVTGVRRLNPKVPHQARPIPAIMVMAIAGSWSSSRAWWKRMVALMVLASFLAVVRGAGILCVPLRGVTWVRGLREYHDPVSLPPSHTGVMLLLTKRKTRQCTPSWVPLRAGKVTQMLAKHVLWRREGNPQGDFLFPARRASFKGKQRSWAPHPANRMSTTSFTRLIRKALVEVCGLAKSEALKFTVHGLRVGGINFYRRRGVSVSLRAQMADHQSLESSRRYLRLLPAEQLSVLDSTVLPH